MELSSACTNSRPEKESKEELAESENNLAESTEKQEKEQEQEYNEENKKTKVQESCHHEEENEFKKQQQNEKEEQWHEHTHKNYKPHEVNSLEHFQRYSRLHFIGQFKTHVDDLFRKWFVQHPAWNHGELHQQCLFIHVDMDAFFCSVQLAKEENAHLRELPVAIAAGRNNSDISSCNYIARSFGIQAGMYVNAARVRCPHLITLNYDMPSCEHVAHTLYRILFEFFPVEQAHMSMEVYSVDEVMIAVDTDNIPLMEEYCQTVRNELEQTTRCTASCGIAPNIMLARLATQSAKPNGIHVIHRNEIANVMQELPFSAIHGVGRRVFAKVRDRLLQKGLIVVKNETNANPKNETQYKQEEEESESEWEEKQNKENQLQKEGHDAAKNNNNNNSDSSDDNNLESSDSEDEVDDQITCGVVQKLSKEEMQLLLGKKNGETIYLMCRGVDRRVVTRTGDAVNKRVMGKSMPNSLGCTMNYAVRPTCRADIYKIANDLLHDVCGKVARAGVTVSGLRVTILERHPLHPKQTPKYMGRGFCLELHIPIRLRHPLDENDTSAMLAQVQQVLASLLIDSREQSDVERARQLGILDRTNDHASGSKGKYTGWTLPVTSLPDIVIEDVRGMTIQATGLKLKNVEAFPELEKPAHKVIHDQMSLASAFARAAMANEHDAHHTSSTLNNVNKSHPGQQTSHRREEDYTFFVNEAKKRRMESLYECEQEHEQKQEEEEKCQIEEEVKLREETHQVQKHNGSDEEEELETESDHDTESQVQKKLHLWKLLRSPLNVDFCTQWHEAAREALSIDDVPRIKAYVRCALYKLSNTDNADASSAECITTLAIMVSDLLADANIKYDHELLLKETVMVKEQ